MGELGEPWAHAPLPFVMTDAEGLVAEWNRAAERVFGWAREEVLGRDVADLVIPPRYRKAHRAALARLARTGARDGGRLHIDALHRDGSEFPAVLAVWASGRGDLRRICAVVEDVGTERQEHDLEFRNAELEASNERLSAFAHVVAHELKEPLRAVGGFTELLRQRCEGRLGDEVEEFIAYVIEGVGTMEERLADLLTYSEVERHVPLVAPVDCSELVDALIGHLEASPAGSDMVVQRETLPVVEADSEMIERVFSELLDNAAKFRSPERAARVRVRARRLVHAWRFDVSDNGIGIGEAGRGQVLEAFRQLHPKGQYPGTGMGLALARACVQHHGGDLWVSAANGGGTTVSFTIPDPLPAS